MNFVKGNKPTQYETVEDSKDLRIPVQSEEAFEHGIVFKCKYIGTEEIPRPNSRVEIVAAMRRIRYEHKYRNIKKRKVFLEISADGVRITIRKKKRKAVPNLDESSLFIMHYPINRVFYVSHDSQDLKILSYIARGEDGVFRCSVFKALKKSQAMHVVRTIGQAFEVCHKINTDREQEKAPGEEKNTLSENVHLDGDKNPNETDIDDVPESDVDSPMIHAETRELQRPVSTLVTDLDTVRDMKDLPPPLIMPPPSNQSHVPSLVNGQLGSQKHGPFTLQQLQQLYHQQLLHQMQEAETSRNELSRMRGQLKTESESRTQAQQQVNRLLAQNRELIVVIHKLMSQLQENYSKANLEPFNETWVLSQLSSNATVLSSSGNVFPDSSAGLGTIANEFDSKVFDNSNTDPSPRHQTVNSSTPYKETLTFDDLVTRKTNAETFLKLNHNAEGGDPSMAGNLNSIPETVTNANSKMETNPFTPVTTATDMYKFAFNNTDNSINASQNQSSETEIS